MARSRNIKPGFFKNEMLAECAPLARLLFAGLWCLADRAGRLEDRPKRIRAELMPYDDGSVNGMLEELHQAGFIIRYEVGGKRFIQVVNFDKHQNPHHREAESTIPAPDETRTASGKPGASPGLAPDKPGTSPELAVLIPDSLNLPLEIPTSSGAFAPPAISEKQADPIFGGCLDFLKSKGAAEKGARSFLGLMRKNHGDDALVQAIERAERDDITDPIPWISKYLESKPKGAQVKSEEWAVGLL